MCWGLTSQSTIFQSCRDGATASWVINQYFRGVKCLAQGHNTAAVGIEPPTSRSGVRHSTTEPPRSPDLIIIYYYTIITEKVTIKRVMQIHNIMVLIFITCAVINHLFIMLWSMSVMHFFFLMIQALFKVNNFQYE